QTFDLTFDLSVFDLFMAWGNGASVHAGSPVDLVAPARYVNRHQLTVWFSVPSVPAQMLRRQQLRPDALPTLRWSLFCGEPLPQRSAESWQQAAPNSTVENLYGPTELTIACFMHRWDPDLSPPLCRNEIVPIGRPIPGLMAALVDGEARLTCENSGELCVAGPQTTPGYWQAPAVTAERYIDLPVSRHEARRFYRTGDLVSVTPQGEYQFLGRADQQIKILGHRIELGEIEAALRADAAVEHAVAFGWPLPPLGAEMILAFVSGGISQTGSLLARAKQTLPAYAVPRRIIIVDEMPLNPNGKVDRKALAARIDEHLGGQAQV
ncbi:MAG: AMP-binding protein, partial [Bryobacterales bacterium]|nr:AMP-binding protein [Bryobacterales bacterium]